MRPYPRFGGESVSFAKTSLALYILYSLFLLLSTLWLLYGSSGLLRKLAHPVHLKMHRYVIPLSPPQKKAARGSFGRGLADKTLPPNREEGLQIAFFRM